MNCSNCNAECTVAYSDGTGACERTECLQAREELLSTRRVEAAKKHIPPQYLEPHKNHPATARYAKAIDAWRRKPNPGILVLYGIPGTGKTQALYDLMLRAAREGVAFHFFDMSILVGQFQALAGRDYGEMIDRVHQIAETHGIVAIDDVGVEKLSEFATAQVLNTIIAQREKWDRPTILTTNFGPRECVGRYGDRMADRIFSKRATRIHFANKSFRMGK